MNNNKKNCFICAGQNFKLLKNGYERCCHCGHEILLSTNAQGLIINDVLSKEEVLRVTNLDRFKNKTLSFFDISIERKKLLDIGSASGKFLYQNAGRYSYVTGIEITPESLGFSRHVLGLDIVEDIQGVSGEVSVATAWHSLEHIPVNQLLLLLDSLSNKMHRGARIIVSVPNGASWQCRIFGKAYAYYDVPNHLHQFTHNSLIRLMQNYGFREVTTVASRTYNCFGYIQGLLNLMTITHNYLYYRAKRRSQKPSILMDIYNTFLLFIIIPIGTSFGFIESCFSSRQGVITVCFEKNKS